MFEDDRGKIEDVLVESLDSVTRIATKKGCTRGNHYHMKTTQWTYVLSGVLSYKHHKFDDGPKYYYKLGPGDMMMSLPLMVHSWFALEDTDCLVFTKGPRSGSNYESDTYRVNPEDDIIVIA